MFKYKKTIGIKKVSVVAFIKPSFFRSKTSSKLGRKRPKSTRKPKKTNKKILTFFKKSQKLPQIAKT